MKLRLREAHKIVKCENYCIHESAKRNISSAEMRRRALSRIKKHEDWKASQKADRAEEHKDRTKFKGSIAQ